MWVKLTNDTPSFCIHDIQTIIHVLYFIIFFVFYHFILFETAGLTLEGDSGEEVAFWLLTSLCTSAKREVEVAL